MNEAKEAKFTAHSLSDEELEEIYNARVTMAIVWSGKLSDLQAVCKFLHEKGSRIVYRKAGKNKLIITAQTDEGDVNANSE